MDPTPTVPIESGRKRGKSLSRRYGQNGTVQKIGRLWRGRYYIDLPGVEARYRKSVPLGLISEMTVSEARRKLREILHQEGVDRPSYVIPSALSFAKHVKNWEQNYIAKRKPSTQVLLRYHLKYLRPKWGGFPMDGITADMVNEWVGASELAHLSPVTIRGLVKTLQTVLGRRFGRGKISYPSQDEHEEDPRCYTSEEILAIVNAAVGQYQVLYRLAAETGARAGELYALGAEDLLFEHDVVKISKSVFKQKVGSPKSKNAVRWVNVTSDMMAMLKTYLNGRTTGFVFLTEKKGRGRGGMPLNNSTVLNKHLHPLLRQLGFERGGMHGFRHHRVSTLVMSGVGLETIKRWIGHGSEEMVRRYTHLRPDFLRNELAKVANPFAATPS